MPSVEGTTYCNDDTGDLCKAHGNCTTCTTFNQADIDHIKSLGWNFIRLGVVWAGAQPSDEDKLDEDFVQRLHAVLDLTDKNGIHVMLDNHGDMVSSSFPLNQLLCSHISIKKSHRLDQLAVAMEYRCGCNSRQHLS